MSSARKTSPERAVRQRLAEVVPPITAPSSRVLHGAFEAAIEALVLDAIVQATPGCPPSAPPRS